MIQLVVLEDLFSLPDRELVGGKFFGLALAQQALSSDLSCYVPRAICVTTEGMRTWLGRPTEDSEYLSGPRVAENAIAERPLPEPMGVELRQAIAKIGENHSLAVRSSAVDEDLATASFAGQYATVLGTRDFDETLAALRQCAAAAFASSVSAYRKHSGLTGPGSFPAIVIQRMVAARASGVLFTRRTEAANSPIYLEAVHGLGERLVSGRDVASRASFSQAGDRVLDWAIEEQRCGTFLCNGVVVERSLSYREQISAPVDVEEMRRLCAIGRQLETVTGRPLDIEWAIDIAGSIALLQARPLVGPKVRGT